MSPHVRTGDAVVAISASWATTQRGDLMTESVRIASGPTTGTGTTVAENDSPPVVAGETRDIRAKGERVATVDANETRSLKVKWVSSVEATGPRTIPSENAGIVVILMFVDGSGVTKYVAATERENGSQANTNGGN